jgi:hypothetical protein
MKLPPIIHLCVQLTFEKSSSGLRSRRRTYHTILKLADHAHFKMVKYVFLRPDTGAKVSSQLTFAPASKKV